MRIPHLAAIWIFGLLPMSSALAQADRSSSTKPLSRSISPATAFTEGDAKSRFEARGYSNIHGLHKDAFGIWRGQGRGTEKPSSSVWTLKATSELNEAIYASAGVSRAKIRVPAVISVFASRFSPECVIDPIVDTAQCTWRCARSPSVSNAEDEPGAKRRFARGRRSKAGYWRGQRSTSDRPPAGQITFFESFLGHVQSAHDCIGDNIQAREARQQLLRRRKLYVKAAKIKIAAPRQQGRAGFSEAVSTA